VYAAIRAFLVSPCADHRYRPDPPGFLDPPPPAYCPMRSNRPASEGNTLTIRLPASTSRITRVPYTGVWRGVSVPSPIPSARPAGTTVTIATGDPGGPATPVGKETHDGNAPTEAARSSDEY
jgi:hypothetical protein